MSESARRQVAVNFGFTLVKSAFVLLSIRLADVMLTAQMMGLVLLFRRQGALWSNLIQLGLSQVLLKYYTASNDLEYRTHLWGRLVRWVGVAMVVSILGGAMFADQINPWLFPTAPPAVTAAFAVYVAGLALGFIANSSWLAEFRFFHSNIIDWLHGSLLFVICILLVGEQSDVIFAWGLAILTLLTGVLSLWRFARCFGYRLSQTGGWSISSEERSYGLTRSLSAYLDLATFVIGPWLLRSQPYEAAQLIAAYTVLRIAQTLVMPVAQVLALRANSQRYANATEERRLLILCGVVFVCALLATLMYYIVGAWAVKWWLPNSSEGVLKILDQLMPFMPGVCIFYALRGFVDLKFLIPWNLVVLLVGIVIFIVTFFFASGTCIDKVVTSSAGLFSVFYIYGAVFFLTVNKGPIWRAK